MGDPGKAEERADRGYGDTSGVDRSAVSGTSYLWQKQNEPKH